MKQILGHSIIVRNELERFLRAKRETAGPITHWHTDVLNRLLPFTTAGKLLRGSLLCFSYETFSGKQPNEMVLKAAAALELTHSALLIHDDIMDNDDLRRGQLALHQQYRDIGKREQFTQAEHFGNSMGMSAGDMALFLAFELLADCPGNATRLFAEQLQTTGAGQMQDLYLEIKREVPEKHTLYELMENKTASYTLALPLIMGALLAEAPERTEKILRTIGLKAGIIFQIRDDELGVTGDSKQTGKPIGSDIIEGKKTLLYTYLLQRCDMSELKKLQIIFGNASATTKDIAYVQRLVIKHDITKLLDDAIWPLEQEALAAIEKLSVRANAQRELTSLVRFCAERPS